MIFAPSPGAPALGLSTESDASIYFYISHLPLGLGRDRSNLRHLSWSPHKSIYPEAVSLRSSLRVFVISLSCIAAPCICTSCIQHTLKTSTSPSNGDLQVSRTALSSTVISDGSTDNQITPFNFTTPDDETLYAWHVIPPGLYAKHEEEILKQPSGLAEDITKTKAFDLLTSDPQARLIISCEHSPSSPIGVAMLTYLQSMGSVTLLKRIDPTC